MHRRRGSTFSTTGENDISYIFTGEQEIPFCALILQHRAPHIPLEIPRVGAPLVVKYKALYVLCRVEGVQLVPVPQEQPMLGGAEGVVLFGLLSPMIGFLIHFLEFQWQVEIFAVPR